ncbi:MAG: RagB/SusD family nutrient uptake outer membrane protein [Balneolaceae bacterium]|nr:MAG: RagB/SusD family nutrient uptake outer membrane protein [Balneolaceae bacterium]
MKTSTITLFITLIVLLSSCTDLGETVRDTALQQEALDNPNASEQILAPVYERMLEPLERHNWFNNLQGVSSMEQIVPFRGGTDWFDGGRFIEMHQHSWTPTHTTIGSAWRNLTQGIGRGAIAEKTIQDLGGNQALIAEARALKALYNYWLLDLYNVSFDKQPEDVGTPALSEVFRGAEAVNYIYSELNAVQGLLPAASVNETRFNQDAVIALKARLLLNKAVYSDRYATAFNHNPEDLNAVIRYSTELINRNYLQLESNNYFYLFGKENEGNTEVIFAFNQQPETGGGHRLSYFHASRNRHGNPWHPSKTGSDGGALTQDFYDLWEGERDDPRFFHRFLPDEGSVTPEEFRWNRGVQIGQQYGIVPDPNSSNVYQQDEDGKLLILPLVDFARSGQLMNYTREVGLESDRGHLAGARSIKWDNDKYLQGSQSSINIPVLRLGEMYLSRAEANARLGNWAAALNDVNTLRAARGARQLSQNELSTLEQLQREWIFEMYQEHKTRTIQIRFNTYTEGTWRDKGPTDVIRRVFPIPQFAIDAAQIEEGYLVQNPGY